MNNSKDIYEQLALKFSYLSNLKPAGVKQKFTLFDNLLSDSFVHDYNPSRYAFYMELMKAFQKPDVLKNVIYENKLIKSKQEELDEIYQKITNKLNALYRVNETDSDNARKEKIQNVNEKIAAKVNKVVGNYYQKNDDFKTIINDTFGATPEKQVVGGAGTGAAPVPATVDTAKVPPEEAKVPVDPEKKSDIIKNFKAEKAEFYNNDGLMKYKNRLEKVMEDGTDPKIKAQKLSDIVKEFDEDPKYSMKNFNLTKEDKLIFIFVTFIIRLLSLMIIDWSLTSNFIVNFYQAYILYIGLYCIFLALILVIVNMTYSVSLQDAGKDNSFAVTLASSMYFFYFVPGKRWSSSLRILVHFSVIILMTLISLFIVSGQRNQEGTINYNYSEKKYIKRQLNNFTLILWLFTSFLALTFKVS